MSEKLSPEEVAILIQARKILRAKGLAKDSDVKAICQTAGISRKTGYQWANKLGAHTEKPDEDYHRELGRLKVEHQELKKRYDDLDFENEGRKLAWEIHGVDELLGAKKNTTAMRKRKKR
jgi:hypothetical protein